MCGLRKICFKFIVSGVDNTLVLVCPLECRLVSFQQVWRRYESHIVCGLRWITLNSKADGLQNWRINRFVVVYCCGYVLEFSLGFELIETLVDLLLTDHDYNIGYG